MLSEMLSSNRDHVNTLQYICTCVMYIDVVTVYSCYSGSNSLFRYMHVHEMPKDGYIHVLYYTWV